MVKCEAGSASRMVDADCKVHLIVEDVSVETQYGVSLKCKFGVLGATDPAQVGKSVTEFFQCQGKAVDKLYNLAEATGLITAQQRKHAAEQGVGLDIDETLLKGRQLCAEIKMEQNQRKNPVTGQYEIDPENPGPYPRIGFRTFGVMDRKAHDIPKDQQFLGMLKQARQPTEQPASFAKGSSDDLIKYRQALAWSGEHQDWIVQIEAELKRRGVTLPPIPPRPVLGADGLSAFGQTHAPATVQEASMTW